MKTSPTSKWIVDAALLLGFCVSILLDLTGLELHQWIGVGVGLLAGYHLLTHLDWVTAVTRRFFGQTSSRARLYYLLDALILGGFVTIGLTGLLISTWLNLDGVAALAALHQWTAYLTLAALVVKLALHRRWIVNVAGKFFSTPAARPAPDPVANRAALSSAAPIAPDRSYTRREFLKLIGVAAVSTVAVAGVTAKTLDVLQALDSDSSSAANAPGSSTSTTSSGAISTGASATTPVCMACRRGKHCAFPGDCHSYVDSNGNNLCDHGECA